MKRVTWIDDRGYKRSSWIKDDDPDSEAPRGIPDEIPDIERLDWEQIKKDIHNELMDRGMTSWDSLQGQQQVNLSNLIGAIIKKYLVALYRS